MTAQNYNGRRMGNTNIKNFLETEKEMEKRTKKKRSRSHRWYNNYTERPKWNDDDARWARHGWRLDDTSRHRRRRRRRTKGTEGSEG